MLYCPPWWASGIWAVEMREKTVRTSVPMSAELKRKTIDSSGGSYEAG